MDAFGNSVPGRPLQRDLDCLAAEIGCRSGGPRIAPPGIADLLAGPRQTDKGPDVALIARKRGQEPSLRLGAKFGAQRSFEYCVAADETLADPKLRIRANPSAAGRLLDQQQVKYS